MARKNLRDDQRERIAHLLPGKEGDRGGAAADNRLFVGGVCAGSRFSVLLEHAGRVQSALRRKGVVRILLDDHYL
jgi:hypothetical protein